MMLLLVQCSCMMQSDLEWARCCCKPLAMHVIAYYSGTCCMPCCTLPSCKGASLLPPLQLTCCCRHAGWQQEVHQYVVRRSLQEGSSLATHNSIKCSLAMVRQACMKNCQPDTNKQLALIIKPEEAGLTTTDRATPPASVPTQHLPRLATRVGGGNKTARQRTTAHQRKIKGCGSSRLISGRTCACLCLRPPSKHCFSCCVAR